MSTTTAPRKTRKARKSTKASGPTAAERCDALVAQVAARLIEMMENGEAGTWLRPWTTVVGGASVMFPLNARTGGRYTGFNPIRLAIAATDAGYTSGLWATYVQWQQLGAQVRKNEKGTECVRWITVTKRDKATGEVERHDDGTAKTFTVPKIFSLFAAEQVDGYEPPAPPEQTWTTVEAAEAFFEAQGSTIIEKDSAYYSPMADYIGMPPQGAFTEADAYYATLAHEHIHWTGHGTRNNRQLHNRFGSDAYAVEELIAELGAASLCAHLGLSLEPRPDHAAYLANWISVLKEDPKAVLRITGDAGRAVEFLIGAESTEGGDDE